MVRPFLKSLFRLAVVVCVVVVIIISFTHYYHGTDPVDIWGSLEERDPPNVLRTGDNQEGTDNNRLEAMVMSSWDLDHNDGPISLWAGVWNPNGEEELGIISTGNVPQTEGNVPQTDGNVPQTEGNVPQTEEGVSLLDHGGTTSRGLQKWRQVAMEINVANSYLYDMYQGNLAMRYPKAVVIGSGKCGTGAMRYFLSEHPYLQAMTKVPEPDVFKRSFSPSVKKKYLTLMPYSLGNQVTIEKTPMYVGYKDAPRIIKQNFPDMKLIFVVRDPVKRVISDFVQQMDNSRRAHRPAPWRMEDFGKVLFMGNRVNEDRGIVKSSRFDLLIDKWLTTFPRGQLHISDGEELIANTSVAMGRIESFLEVPHFFEKEHFYYNASRHLVCVTVPAPHCLPSSKGREHPVVTDKQLDILYDYFRPHVHKFFEKAGLDFDWGPRYY